MKRLLRSLRNEEGLGIVEILVSLMIFAIVALGMSYSMISMTRLTGDAAARETATNLAAQEIDRVAAIPDAFDVVDATQPKQVTIDGITYFVETNTGWVGANGSTDKCGVGGGTLQYKRVRVTVTWDTMYLKNPVRADTALAPSTRINDPTMGTVIIKITKEGGDGQAGVAISMTKTTTGPTVGAIDPTDSDGCSFVLKAPPGTYTMNFTKSNYIDAAQATLPYATPLTVTVTAGAATSVAIQADSAHTFTNKPAANSTRTVKVATNMQITYFGAGAGAPLTETYAATRKVYPWALGYQAVAGNPATCAAVDPTKWTATTGAGAKLAGVRPVATLTTPGGSGTLPVVMGVAEVVIPGASTADVYLAATPKNAPGGGNPGCATLTKLNFAGPFKGGSKQVIALPYGAWTLLTGSSAANTTTTVTTGVTVLDGVVVLDADGNALTNVTQPGGTFTSNTLTFDPRSGIL